MNFEEALKELYHGKYVTRLSWNDGSYLVLMPGIPNIWKVLTQPNPNVGGWPASVADYQADDWSVIPGGIVPPPLNEVPKEAA